jgi:hypothetical protein
MFHKSPNYVFSILQDREISGAEARLRKVLHPVSSIRAKRGRKVCLYCFFNPQ